MVNVQWPRHLSKFLGVSLVTTYHTVPKRKHYPISCLTRFPNFVFGFCRFSRRKNDWRPTPRPRTSKLCLNRFIRGTTSSGEPLHPENRFTREATSSRKPLHPANRFTWGTASPGKPLHPASHFTRGTASPRKQLHPGNRFTREATSPGEPLHPGNRLTASTGGTDLIKYWLAIFINPIRKKYTETPTHCFLFLRRHSIK